MKTVNQIRRITDRFDSVPGDCVSLTSILHHALTEANVAHTMYKGTDMETGAALYNRVSHQGVPGHMWIEVDTKQGRAIIDYRAQSNIGAAGNTPYGVFLKRSSMRLIFQSVEKSSWPGRQNFERTSCYFFTL